ncbi:MarR family transcriptional regulator [Cytobacillus oceanisediminis]|uniref:MarR family transcriptional regulator n=2 Tax=Niallia TaxID=2837506 RepID=A0A941GK79_NIACI|nr:MULTISPECIES: helix-turn-helix domain-containing protein [Bacillaceae]EOR23333.1 regulatory protein MarR [Niallia nealsonii AAU1]MDU1846664.1 helix-turn-helix domain-containing protein [Niallia nealsonii]MBZ9535057.1 MarR family transcriptional regulator [Cytobacillus oceanisediminis]MCB5237703.1 MarR family transcriptional regulator [Niallia circulans]MED3793829.1 helix-turn-helix domain-containing protein [Niallia alba]
MLDRATYIWESIDFLNRFIMKSLQRHAEGHGVTAPQARVMLEVFINKKISVKQLTQNLRMTQSTVSDIVERLTEKGLLIKKPNPKDKRSVQIMLTEKMVKIIEETAPKPIQQIMGSVLENLQPSEQAKVEEGMRLLVAAVGKKMEADGIDDLEDFEVLFLPKENKQ